MIKKIQLLFTLTFASLAAYAADGDVFKANSPEGVEITFKVISEADKTCQVGTGEYSDATISKSYAGPLTIPATANGYKVTTIASWSFYYYPNLTGITISEGVEQLMSNSIEQCGNITDFVIPTSVTSLSSSFGGVGAGLKSISVAEGNAIYDSRENCNAIIETSTNTLVCGCNTTTLPSSITSIGAWSMTYYDHESITIPEKITSIGDGAFRGSSFKEISIPANIKKIGWDAFSYCSKLEKVTILAQECNIGYGAFCYNYSLKEMVCHVLQPQAASSSIITNSDDGISDDFKLYVPYGTKTLYEQTEGWNNVKNVVEFNVAGSSSLAIEDFKMVPGKTKFFLIDVINPSQAITSVEFDMTIPEGLMVATKDGKPDMEFAGRTTTENHSIEATDNGGIVHVKVLSASNATISGKDGALLRIGLTADKSFAGGDIKCSHQILTSPDETKSEPEDLKYAVIAKEEFIISFADENVKAICVANWDTDGDGELSDEEAAAVTSLGGVFEFKSISTFDELKFFTGLTEIGFNDFHYSDLTSVTLPSTITAIGMCAFSKSKLESIEIPESVTSIGYEAFTGTPLKTIVIPANVASINSRAFKSCYKLENVTSLILNPEKTTISDDAFECYTTAILNVPEGTRNAYRNADGWKEFMYTAEPEEELFFEVDGITYGIIYDEYGNASVCLKDGKSASGDYRVPRSVQCDKDGKSYSVTVIGDNAFAGSNITSLCLYVDDGKDYYYNYEVKTFGNGVFSNCTSLKKVTFSRWVTSIGHNLFEGCNALEWIISMIKEPPTVKWDYPALYGWPEYTLYVPFGTTALYEEAGWAPKDNNIIVEGHDNENFTAANAEGVEMTFQIISAAEKTCKVVKKFVDDDTFVSAAPESVTLPTEVKGFKVIAIDGEAFQYSGVKNVIIPEGVTRIGSFAFEESHLTSITIPKSMAEINSAFKGCEKLTTVNISDLAAWCNIKFTGTGSNGLGHLYLNGEEVKDIVIPEGVTSLGENMALSSPFVGCTSLTSVIIPASVTKMYQPFSGCSNLKSIVVDEGNTVYDSRNNCNAIIETETGKLIAGCNNTIIPEGTTYIADQVFSGCTGLSSTVIPEGVTSIGLGAFLGCSNMTSLVIPSSVTYIGILTFDGCTSLTSVTAFAEEPLTIYSGFPNAANATLYVPKGSKAAYEAANYWKEFKEIAEIEDENPDLKDGDTFTALTTDGVEMTFKVISKADMTCQVGSGKSGEPAVDKTYQGPVTIPATINEYKVTSVGDYAFKGTYITSAIISEGVETIGSSIFRGCRYLKTVELPSTLNSMGTGIFIELNDDSPMDGYVTDVEAVISHIVEPFEISYETFGINYGPPEFDSPDEDEVSARALTRGFYGFFNKAKLYVPAGTVDKYKAIRGWSIFNAILVIEDNNPDDIIIFASEDVKAVCISNWDTSGDGELSKGEAAAVTSLGEGFNRLYNCTFDELQYFTGLTKLENYTFNGSILSLTIPATVTKIEENALSGVREIKLSEGILNFIVNEDILYNMSKTELIFCSRGKEGAVAIPTSVRKVYPYAFNECSKLEGVTLPEGLNSIGPNAFYGCEKIKELTLPSTLTEIGVDAFYDCHGLTAVYSMIMEPFTISSTVFERTIEFDDHTNTHYMPSSATLYVPFGKKEQYKSVPGTSYNTNGWTRFAEIVELLNNGDTFTAQTPEGVKMTFKVISATDRTCQVGTGNGEEPAIDKTYNGHITIPAFAKEYKVTRVGNYAFRETNITSASISDGIEWMGESIFRKCQYLKTLELPSTLKRIGNNIFLEMNEDIPEPSATHITAVVSHITEPFFVTSEAFGTINYLPWRDIDPDDDVESFTRSDMMDDNYTIYPSEATLYVPAGTIAKYKSKWGWTMFKEMKESLQGDANTDGKVGEEDVKLVEEYIMTGKAEGLIFTNADTNGNRQLNAADIVKMINIIKSKDSTGGMGDIDPEAAPQVETDVETDDADDI